MSQLPPEDQDCDRKESVNCCNVHWSFLLHDGVIFLLTNSTQTKLIVLHYIQLLLSLLHPLPDGRLQGHGSHLPSVRRHHRQTHAGHDAAVKWQGQEEEELVKKEEDQKKKLKEFLFQSGSCFSCIDVPRCYVSIYLYDKIEFCP